MVSEAQITYILTLIEKQNFQRAAEACFVTQPTLSMQIKKAEEALGGQIINRDTVPISVTAYGQKLIPTLEKILDDYGSLDDEIAKLNGTYKAEIRVGIIPTIAGYLVPDLYDQWQNELGSVQLDIKELKTTDLIKAVEKKQIDFGIMAGPLNDGRFNQQRLFDEEILIYSPTIKSQTVSQADLEELKPWLLSEGNCLRTQMINFCNVQRNEKDAWRYEGGSINMLLKMVELQGGYTLIPSNYLPYLGIDKKGFKRVQNIVPVRQVIGINLSRNSKKEHIEGLMRLIQRNKSKGQLDQIKTEILPWS